MNIHENKELFEQAIRATAQMMKISEIYIEKDYWVTLALWKIFTNPIGKETVFKGGTSLSKCYGLIDRFSEDIDLVVFKSKDETSNQLTNKIKNLGKIVSKVLPEVKVEGLTRKKGKSRKTAHSYTPEFEGDLGQVRKEIILEATCLGDFEPYVSMQVDSYIYQMMIAKSQNKLITKYNLNSFDALVMDVGRTICEKIMSLVRFSYDENPIVALNNKVRHTYDLYQILSKEEYSTFLDSAEFIDMLIRVANDDVKSFKNNNEWLVHHPSECLIFKNVENVWSKIVGTYEGSFSALVHKDLPSSDRVLVCLKRISNRLKDIDSWTIQLDSE